MGDAMMADESVSLSGSEADDALGSMGLLSPSTHTRFQEKEQLQDLNGRLAVFMDRIQCVRDQNENLRAELERSKETHKREMDTHRSLFERELSEARKLLDETAREKAKFELASSRNSTLASDARAKLEEEVSSKSKVEDLLSESERDLQQSRHHVEGLLREQRKLEDRISQLASEVDISQEQSESARTDLESEMVARVNAQNNCQSLHEEIAFTLSVHNQEKEDLHCRLASLEKEHAALKSSFERELEYRVAQSLAIARDEQEKESDRIRLELDQLYSSKLKESTDRHDRDVASLNALSETNLELSNTNHQLSEENANLSAKVAQLSKQLDNREYERLRDREHYRSENERLQKELEVLQHELSSKLTEFADLMDVNIRLDKEISRYHRLLHEQEKKVGLDGALFPRSVPSSVQKQQRMYAAAPLGRPAPPPLSTLPRSSVEPGLLASDQPPPLPARRTSSSDDSDDGAASAADNGASLIGTSSLVSFFTGIGRKRRRGGGQNGGDAADDGTRDSSLERGSAAQSALSAGGADAKQPYAVAVDVCEHGHFVKLTNQLDTDVPLAGWRLERQLDKKWLVYRFPRSAVLSASAFITVWCSGGGPALRSPSDFVARHVSNWREGDQFPLLVIDDDSAIRGSTPVVLEACETSPSGSPSKKRLDGQTGSPAKTPSSGLLTASTQAQAGDCTPPDESAENVDPLEESSPSARQHRVTRSSAKTSKRSGSARARGRSKSPGRRNLAAKSLSTVAAGNESAGADSDGDVVAQLGGNVINEDSSERPSRRTSGASAMFSSAFASRRRVQASFSAGQIGQAAAEQLPLNASLSTTVAAAEARAGYYNSTEEIFHEQGDPGKENCVIC